MAPPPQATPSASSKAKLAAVIKSRPRRHAQGRRSQRRPRPHPPAAWILFLKAFDGMEQNREVTEAELPAGDRGALPLARLGRRPRTGAPATRCSTSSTARLLPYLRELTGTGKHDPRDVLAAVFKDVDNRMLLRLPAARRRQQGQRDRLHLVRRHPHDGAPLRVDAARDARRGRRLGRVLHAAAVDPLHGPAGRPAPRRDRARPRLRHRRLPRRGARAPRSSRSRPVEQRRRAPGEASAASRRSRCRTCSG